MGFTGKIEDIPLLDIIQYLNAGDKTGTLILSRKKEKAYVYFQKGNIVHALAPLRSNIGDLLLENKSIGLKDLQKALVLQKNEEKGTPIGRILVGLGVISSEQLETLMILQIKAAIGHLVKWREGEFNFEINEIVAVDDINLNPTKGITESKLSTQSLLMEALSEMDREQEKNDSGENGGTVSENAVITSPKPEGAEPPPKADEPSPEPLGPSPNDIVDPLKEALQEVGEDSAQAVVPTRVENPEPEVPEVPKEVKSAPPVSSDHQEVQPVRQQSPPVIFYIEDALFKSVVQNVFHEGGFQIFCPSSVEKCLEKVKESMDQRKVPILFIEEGLASGGRKFRSPGMRVLKEKEKTGWKVPVVIMLSEMKQEEVWDFYSAGARAVFPRPIRKDANNEQYIRLIRKLGEIIFKKAVFLRAEMEGDTS